MIKKKLIVLSCGIPYLKQYQMKNKFYLKILFIEELLLLYNIRTVVKGN